MFGLGRAELACRPERVALDTCAGDTTVLVDLHGLRTPVFIFNKIVFVHAILKLDSYRIYVNLFFIVVLSLRLKELVVVICFVVNGCLAGFI